MPNARTHDGITIVTGIVLAPVTYSLLLAQSQPTEAALSDSLLFLGAHLLSGFMFSPDLDIDSAIDNRWGIFYWIWRPYMWLMPHRRLFSHGLIISPLLRLLYFWGVLTLLSIGIAWLLAQIGIVVPRFHLAVASYLGTYMNTHPQEARLITIGFITGSAAHTIADWLSTRGKRFLRTVGLRVPQNRGGDRH